MTPDNAEELQNDICGIVSKYGVEKIYDATDEILAVIERYTRPAKDPQVLVKLIKCMIENDPNETISDAGHTVYQLWKHDAQQALKQWEEQNDRKL